MKENLQNAKIEVKIIKNVKNSKCKKFKKSFFQFFAKKKETVKKPQFFNPNEEENCNNLKFLSRKKETVKNYFFNVFYCEM